MPIFLLYYTIGTKYNQNECVIDNWKVVYYSSIKTVWLKSIVFKCECYLPLAFIVIN